MDEAKRAKELNDINCNCEPVIELVFTDPVLTVNALMKGIGPELPPPDK